MLCIKVGMVPEFNIAKTHAAPGTVILSGIQTVETLQKNVPANCTGIMSFGMCGGISPALPVVGETVIASHLLGPNGEYYYPDAAWNDRLYAKTKARVQTYYSNGKFNTANTPAQREAIYRASGNTAWCIDDESLAVAQFARIRKIPFTILRNVSDQWDDDVSITATLLNSSGGVDPWQVFKAVVSEPIYMIEIGRAYEKCKTELTVAAVQIEPSFQLPY